MKISWWCMMGIYDQDMLGEYWGHGDIMVKKYRHWPSTSTTLWIKHGWEIPQTAHVTDYRTLFHVRKCPIYVNNLMKKIWGVSWLLVEKTACSFETLHQVTRVTPSIARTDFPAETRVPTTVVPLFRRWYLISLFGGDPLNQPGTIRGWHYVVN